MWLEIGAEIRGKEKKKKKRGWSASASMAEAEYTIEEERFDGESVGKERNLKEIKLKREIFGSKEIML